MNSIKRIVCLVVISGLLLTINFASATQQVGIDSATTSNSASAQPAKGRGAKGGDVSGETANIIKDNLAKRDLSLRSFYCNYVVTQFDRSEDFPLEDETLDNVLPDIVKICGGTQLPDYFVEAKDKPKPFNQYSPSDKQTRRIEKDAYFRLKDLHLSDCPTYPASDPNKVVLVWPIHFYGIEKDTLSWDDLEIHEFLRLIYDLESGSLVKLERVERYTGASQYGYEVIYAYAASSSVKKESHAYKSSPDADVTLSNFSSRNMEGRMTPWSFGLSFDWKPTAKPKRAYVKDIELKSSFSCSDNNTSSSEVILSLDSLNSNKTTDSLNVSVNKFNDVYLPSTIWQSGSSGDPTSNSLIIESWRIIDVNASSTSPTLVEHFHKFQKLPHKKVCLPEIATRSEYTADSEHSDNFKYTFELGTVVVNSGLPQNIIDKAASVSHCTLETSTDGINFKPIDMSRDMKVQKSNIITSESVTIFEPIVDLIQGMSPGAGSLPQASSIAKNNSSFSLMSIPPPDLPVQEVEEVDINTYGGIMCDGEIKPATVQIKNISSGSLAENFVFENGYPYGSTYGFFKFGGDLNGQIGKEFIYNGNTVNTFPNIGFIGPDKVALFYFTLAQHNDLRGLRQTEFDSYGSFKHTRKPVELFYHLSFMSCPSDEGYSYNGYQIDPSPTMDFGPVEYGINMELSSQVKLWFYGFHIQPGDMLPWAFDPYDFAGLKDNPNFWCPEDTERNTFTYWFQYLVYTIHFKPSGVGDFVASHDNSFYFKEIGGGINAGAYRLLIKGKGVLPKYTITPSTVDFGLVDASAVNGVNRTFTIKNVGNCYGALNNPLPSNGTNDDFYQVGSSGVICLAQNQSKTITICFNPRSAGKISRNFTFTPYNGNPKVTPVSVAFTGEGGGDGKISASSATEFNDFYEDGKYVTKNIQIKNTGTGYLKLNNVSIIVDDDDDSDEFKLGTLPALPKTLNVGDVLSIPVDMSMGTLDGISAKLHFQYTDVDNTAKSADVDITKTIYDVPRLSVVWQPIWNTGDNTSKASGVLYIKDVSDSFTGTFCDWKVSGAVFADPGASTATDYHTPIITFPESTTTIEQMVKVDLSKWVDSTHKITATRSVKLQLKCDEGCYRATTKSVDLYSGAKLEFATDMALKGVGLDWQFSRTYNSRNNEKSVLGYGWESNWSRKITQDGTDPGQDLIGQNGMTLITVRPMANTSRTVDPATTIYMHLGEGSGTPFLYVSAVDNPAIKYYKSPKGSYGRLIKMANGEYHYRSTDGMIDTYYGFTGSSTDGLLKSTEDRYGNKITLAYNSDKTIKSFTDTIGRVINLTYYDTTDPDTDGLLKTISDGRRTVTYTYDGEGNLTMVDNFGRKTKYAYFLIAENSTKPELWHNLKAVYRPREVAKNLSSPVAYKTITYETDTTKFSYDRVKSQFAGETTISGGTNTYEYLKLGDVGFSIPSQYTTYISAGGDPIVGMTRHTNEAGEKIQYYYNSYGYIVYTEHVGATQTYGTFEGYDADMRRTTYINEAGAKATTEYLGLASDDFDGLGQYYHGNVSTTNQEGCGCSGGGGVFPQSTTFNYEPMSGSVWKKVDAEGNITKYLYDFQETDGSTADILAMANILGLNISGSNAAKAWNLLYAMLPGTESHVFSGINFNGDNHCDAASPQYFGNVVKEILPNGQSRLYSWNNDGQLNYSIDEKGYKTTFSYYVSSTESPGALKGFLKEKIVDVDWHQTIVDFAWNERPTDSTAVNARWLYQYDDRGNIINLTNPRGVREDYVYNDYDELTEVHRAANFDASYGPTVAEPTSNPYVSLVKLNIIIKYIRNENGDIIQKSIGDPLGGSLCADTIDTFYDYNILGQKVLESQEVDWLHFNKANYYYDAAGHLRLLVHVKDAANNQATADYYDYDDHGRLKDKFLGISSLGACQYYQSVLNPPTPQTFYYPSGSVTSHIGYIYDDYNRLSIENTYKDNVIGTTNYTTITYGYDNYNRNNLIINPLSDKVYLNFDNLCRIIERRNFDSTVTNNYDTAIPLKDVKFTYDSLSHVKTKSEMVKAPGQITPDWLTTTYTYDERGYPKQTTNVDASYITYEYNGIGKLSKTTDNLGNQVQNWYDSLGNLIESKETKASTPFADNNNTFSKSFVTTYYYDAVNRLISKMDPAKGVTDYAYTVRDQLWVVCDPNGPSSPTSPRPFNRRGESSEAISATTLGNLTFIDRDGNNQIIQRRKLLDINGNGLDQDMAQGNGDGTITEKYSYEDNGLLDNLTDDNGNVTRWIYDNQNRKMQEIKGLTDPAQTNGASTIWNYNVDGTTQKTTKEDGRQITYDYDDNHRLTHIYVDSVEQKVFEYDALGRVKKATDRNGPGTADDVVTTYEYDSLDRVTHESLQIGSGPTSDVRSTYWMARRTSLTYPSATTVNYNYLGSSNLMNRITIGNDGIVAYDFLGAQVLRRTPMNGVSLDLTDTHQTLFLNDLGLPTWYMHAKDGYVRVAYNYAYDRVGNVLFKNALHDPNDTQLYQYDSAYQLLGFVRGDNSYSDADKSVYCNPTGSTASGLTQSMRWDLDGAGNWKQLTAMKNNKLSVSSMEVDKLNGYTRVGLAKPAYDACGNLLSDAKGQTYQWDGLGRLVGVKDRTGAQLGTYLYDTNNRRVRKTYPNGSGGLKATDYVYDGWQVLEEREDGNPVRRYVYGRELDEPVMMEVITGATAIRYFYHQDLNHNVAGLTDIYGNLVESDYYDPYGAHVRVLPGNLRAAEAPSTVGNPYLFAGRTFDSETGLYYNRNRYYDSHVGRFISRDPIGYEGGTNLYAYVIGNPINLLDPMGLEGTALNLQEGLRGALTIPSQADNRYSGYLLGSSSGVTYEDYQRIHSAQWAVEDATNSLWNTALNAGTSLLGWGANYANFKDGYNESGPLTWDNRLAYGMADASTAMGLATMGLMASEAGLAAKGIGTGIDLGQETIAVCPNNASQAFNPASILTPYELEIQSETEEAISALNQAQSGANLYRIGELGKSMAGESQYWATQNPLLNQSYANQIGLPGVKTDFLLTGTLNPGASVITNEAGGLGANTGGSIQVVPSQGGVGGLIFHMP